MSKNEKRRIVILSGPVHSGNSGALMQWIDGKSVTGFITPTFNNIKLLYNIETGENSNYEMNTSGDSSIEVGKYQLCKESFEIANTIVRNAIQQPNKRWLVVDEIGKLELKEEGHHSLILKLLAHWNNSLLFVVRDYLLEQVIREYDLKDAEIIDQQKLKYLV